MIRVKNLLLFVILLSAPVFAVILILATMFAGTETANAFDFIKGINYSPHMPGENCSEFGKANYSQDLEWMKRAKINTIRTKSDLTSPVIDDFEDADMGDWGWGAPQCDSHGF